MCAKQSIYAVITGSGSYIPPVVVKNSEFENNIFMNEDGSRIETPGKEITDKFEQITDIIERRVAPEGVVTSDMATYAAEEAINTAGIDKEKLDYIIVAHNLGDMKKGSLYPDILPPAPVKQWIKIQCRCLRYDLWVPGLDTGHDSGQLLH